MSFVRRYLHRISRLFHFSSIPYGAILMLHRVDTPDKAGIWYNEHLKMSPATIRQMVNYARSKGCDFVSLKDITRHHYFWQQPRKQIVITLDDGYRDNYLNGYQTFRVLKVPYCIYVCTKMVEGEMCYWWEILEKLILRETNVVITLLNGTELTFDCSTKEKKELAFLDIREIILKLPQNSLVDNLKILFSKYDMNYSLGDDSLGLTWEQIEELSKETLCTIGNHTYSHLAFTGCSDDAIKEDIQHAADKMKAHTNIEMQDFAFPFGEATAVSQHDIELVKELGFNTSATTKSGFVCYGTDPLELPRIFVTEKNWKQVIDSIVVNC